MDRMGLFATLSCKEGKFLRFRKINQVFSFFGRYMYNTNSMVII